MPKKQTKKSYKEVVKNKTITFVTLIVLLTLIVGLCVFWLAHRNNKYAGKDDFERASTSVASVYGNIESSTGPPTNKRLSKTCTEVNLKYGHGPITCDVNMLFDYPVNSIQEADELVKKISQGVDASSGITIMEDRPDIMAAYERVQAYPYASVTRKFVENISGIQCDLYLKYVTTGDSDSIKGVSLNANIGCHALSKYKYYPAPTVPK